MTKRDAPLTRFGNGLPPFGSAVVPKSRFRFYSGNPTARTYPGSKTAERPPLNRLADKIPGKAPDHDVFTKLSDLRCHQLVDRLVGVLNETLLEQTNRAVKLVELSIDNFLHHVLRLAFDLRFVDRAFRFHRRGRNIFAAHIQRMC